MKILVSACLLGRNCKYNGGNNYSERLVRYLQGREVVEVCPEVLAGLGTPRTPIELLDGVVVSRDGNVVDGAVRAAVAQILRDIDALDIECAILKSRSPTCGVHQIYDGTFSGQLVDGAGGTARLLKKHGIPVINETEVEEWFAGNRTEQQGRRMGET